MRNESLNGNMQLMKDINKSRILNLIFKERIISRVDIANETRLSKTTVSALVDELLIEEIVHEIGVSSSLNVGRKAIMLEINKDWGYVLGISLGNHKIYSEVYNIGYEIISSSEMSIEKGNENVLKQILSIINNIIENSGLSINNLKGIGISTPGILDEKNCIIKYSSFLEIKDLDIGQVLKQKYSVPVVITKDTNAAAFAENWFNADEVVDKLVYLNVDEGIGAGFIIDGKIYEGSFGAAGEIGHTKVRNYGEICTCGNIGCIETYLTYPYILDKVNCIMKKDGQNVFSTIEEAMLSNTKEVQEIFQDTIDVLSQTIAAIINLLSPEKFIINGWISSNEDFFIRVYNNLAKFPFPIEGREKILHQSKLGERASLIGASSILLNDIFKGYSLGK